VRLRPFACAALLAVAASAQDPWRGRVVDDDGRPIAGVAVCPIPSLDTFVTTELAAHPAAHSDNQGWFTLAPSAASDGMKLLFEAPGHMHVVAQARWTMVLPVVLPRGRGLQGRVRDAAGRPIAGVRVEATDYLVSVDFLADTDHDGYRPRVLTAVRTDAKGVFALAGACDTGASLTVSGRGWRTLRLAPVAAADPLDLTLQRDPDAERDAATPAEADDGPRSVVVMATDAAGRKVQAFRAAVFRFPRNSQTARADADLLRTFEGAAVAAVDGVARVRWSGMAGNALIVFVLADGHALARGEGPVDASELQVQLEPAVPCRGRVVDAATGAPIAGAHVWSTVHRDGAPRSAPNYPLVALEPGSFAVRSGVDGTFALPHEPAGRRDLRVVAEGYRDGSLVSELPAAEDAVVRLAAQRVVTGKLHGRLPPCAVAVLLSKGQSAVDHFNSTTGASYLDSVPLSADGGFRLVDPAEGRSQLFLVSLRRGRQGLPDLVPLDTVDITPTTQAITLGAPDAMPATVRGRITGSVPPYRLAVISAPVGAVQMHYAFLRYEGPICPVGLDGTFVLRAPAGLRLLVVIDLWTGAMLYRGEVRAGEPGSESRIDLAVEGVPVNFRIPAEGAEQALCIELVPDQAQWPKDVGCITGYVRDGGPDYTTRMGAVLVPGQLAGTLWLPAAPCELQLRAMKWHREAILDQHVIDAARPAEREVVFQRR
jgi:hypothetical protein